MLDAWLDYHRTTLLMKCAGLDEEQLKRRSAEPSTLSLLGLVRHMTEVERGWFLDFGGVEYTPFYWSKDNYDGDFDYLDSAPVDRGVRRVRRGVRRIARGGRGPFAG